MAMLKGCQTTEYQNYGTDTTGEKEKRTSKKNVDGRSTSSHDKKFRTRSVEKQRNGIWFGEDGDSCYKTGWMDITIIVNYNNKQNSQPNTASTEISSTCFFIPFEL